MKKLLPYLLSIPLLIGLYGCSDEPENSQSAPTPEDAARKLGEIMRDAPQKQISVRFIREEQDILTFGTVNRRDDEVFFYSGAGQSGNPVESAVFEIAVDGQWRKLPRLYCGEQHESGLKPGEMRSGGISRAQLDKYSRPLKARIQVEFWDNLRHDILVVSDEFILE